MRTPHPAAVRRPRTAPLAGRYELDVPIGSGGMGTVWRARDHRLGRDVAVKLLGSHDAGLLLRFVREQGVRVAHPHVAAPTGWAADDDQVLLVMPLVAGGSLDRLLVEHGPLPPAYVATLLDQLLQALVSVHGAGVVHRDVKPANLLLEPTGHGLPHLRLADFGVAALLGETRLTQGPGCVGTPSWAAPEQQAGATPDARHDLYSVGRVAATLLTGVVAPHGSEVPVAGPLGAYVAALTDLDPDSPWRPATARDALALLRRVRVPADPAAPAPYVPDRWGRAPTTRSSRSVRSSGTAGAARAPGAAPAPGAARAAGVARAGAVACFAGSITLSLGSLVPLL